MVGRSRSILLTSNDDACMHACMMMIMGRWLLSRKERERAWDPLQSWSPRQREEGGGEP